MVADSPAESSVAPPVRAADRLRSILAGSAGNLVETYARFVYAAFA
ncbi:MAG TPA: hypothetical protein PKX06_17980, partial [Phenylobacterium sp.]|nr:hypothetical protein [Phenylobacterium sp.]